MIDKQSLKNEQPIFYQILSQSLKNKKLPHAFLLVGDDSYDAAHFIAKSILCDNDLLCCNECNDCRKIDEHKYSDLIYYSGKEEVIKKDYIEHIQTTFSKSALEGKSKIYLIENIENANSHAMNSLLKFLEEPIDDVYAIFTTQNLNRVLSTIQSRCQVIQLLPQPKTKLRHELELLNVSKDDINILSELFNHIDDCKKYIESDEFEKLKLEVYHFIEDLYFHRANLIINVQTHLLKDFKEKYEIQLFLNMLVLGLKDLFHVKHSIDLTYPSYKSLYERIEDDPENIIEKINLILETEYLLTSNANVALLMDSMMYNL